MSHPLDFVEFESDLLWVAETRDGVYVVQRQWEHHYVLRRYRVTTAGYQRLGDERTFTTFAAAARACAPNHDFDLAASAG
jgi:hypothetical protein